MVPTNNVASPDSTQPDRVDRSVFDINRFNRTPEARHYVRKASAKTNSVAVSRDEQLHQLVADAQQYSVSANYQAAPELEHKTQTPEEMQELLGRIAQTNQLIKWMREQAIGESS